MLYYNFILHQFPIWEVPFFKKGQNRCTLIFFIVLPFYVHVRHWTIFFSLCSKRDADLGILAEQQLSCTRLVLTATEMLSKENRNITLFPIFILQVLYLTLLHLPPLRFHYGRGCWNRAQGLLRLWRR